MHQRKCYTYSGTALSALEASLPGSAAMLLLSPDGLSIISHFCSISSLFSLIFLLLPPPPSVSAVLTHRLAELGGALLSDEGATKGLINQARPKYKTIRSSDAANLIWEVQY